MTTFALLAVLGAMPSLGLPGFTCSGVDRALCTAWEDRLASQLTRGGGLTVITHGDIEQALGAERQRQLLGCSDGGCLAELAGALGVDAIISGSIARSGSSTIVSIRVVRARDGASLASFTERVKNDDQLIDALDNAAVQLRSTLVPQTPGARPPLTGPIILGASGAALAIGSVISFVLSKEDARALREDTFSTTGAVVARRDAGALKEGLGLTLAVTGVAAAAGAVLWGALAGPGTPQVTIAPVSGGAVVVGGVSW